MRLPLCLSLFCSACRSHFRKWRKASKLLNCLKKLFFLIRNLFYSARLLITIKIHFLCCAHGNLRDARSGSLVTMKLTILMQKSRSPAARGNPTKKVWAHTAWKRAIKQFKFIEILWRIFSSHAARIWRSKSFATNRNLLKSLLKWWHEKEREKPSGSDLKCISVLIHYHDFQLGAPGKRIFAVFMHNVNLSYVLFYA